MSDEPTPAPAPLGAADLDALLSAELDGDLAGAAADLGLAPDVAAARLAATPGAQQRRAALAGARELLGAPVAGLDEHVRSDLVDAAVRAARPDDLAAARARREARHPPRARWLAASAAAVVALGLVVGVALTAGDDDRSDVAASGGTGPDDDGAALPDVGEVRDQHQLRDRLEGLSASPTAGSDSSAEADEPAQPDALLDGSASQYRASAQEAAERDPCIGEIADAYQRTDPPVLAATATFDGDPARVVVFQAEGAQLVVVYAPDDCTTLASQLSR
jgi:hypothetical protein